MSEEKEGGTPRPRAAGRAAVPPGPLADLKALLYELYLAAGTPRLDETAGWIAADSDLQGSPGRATVGRIISSASVPASQADVVAVATVLARRARRDPHDAARQAAGLWQAAQTYQPAGVPLGLVSDPLALEVHRPIEADGAPGLPPQPPYVHRDHDRILAQAAARALNGGSVMAVLVAGSSAGKTRACWEALELLRQAGGWRLWHPRDPGRAEAALNDLSRVGPRTVVWLNETQDYLSGSDGERVAAGLRSLLADPARAPVLVLGTLWPEHHAELTRAPGSQVRQLLDGTVVEVPAAFAGDDLAALKQVAAGDPRLAQAADRAEDGQVTQYLAGGPALRERYYAAPGAAKAMIWAAMDARRLGLGPVLPLAFLENAAPAYLPAAEWDALDDDWAEQALAYCAVPVKGARGPLTRIRPRTARRGGRSTRQASGGGPFCRLADYLDQHGRTERTDEIPPPGFWSAAGRAWPRLQRELAQHAHDRGLYLDAALLWRHAVSSDANAAFDLVRFMRELHPADSRPARFAAHHADLTDPAGVGWLLRALDTTAAAALLARNPAAHADLIHLGAVGWLLETLRGVGADEQASALAIRAAANADPSSYADSTISLLSALRKAGAYSNAAELAGRAAAAIGLDSPDQVGKLLKEFRTQGLTRQSAVLLARDPAAHVVLQPAGLATDLLSALQEAGAHGQVSALADRIVVHARYNPDDAPWLLYALRKAGANDQASALAARAVADVSFGDSDRVAKLLTVLRETGADEQVSALLARNPAAHVDLSDPGNVVQLLKALRETGADEQVSALLARNPAAHVDVSDPVDVVQLLTLLRENGADNQVPALAARAASGTNLSNPSGIGYLLGALRDAGTDDQVLTLAARAAAGVSLRDPGHVARLLSALDFEGTRDQIPVLLARAPVAHVDLSDTIRIASLRYEAYEDVADLLLDALRRAGANHQAAALIARLPASGKFDRFLELQEDRDRFRYGRESDGTPAAPWNWDDLLQ